MERLSRRAYAARRGISEAAVRKAISTGRIQVEVDGFIDPVKADQQWEQNTKAGGRAALPVAAAAPAPPATNGEAPQAAPTASESADERAAREQRRLQQQARSVDLAGRAQMTRLKVGELEGRLVEREAVEAYVFAKMRQIRDAWMSWPTTVAPMMTVDLGLEDEVAVLRVLDRYVRDHLRDIAKMSAIEVAGVAVAAEPEDGAS